MTDREKVLRVIRAVADALRGEKGVPEDGAVAEAIATACDTMGISPQDYRRIVDSDSLLEELEQRAISDAIVTDADPGPYAAISREAASGRPGDRSRSLEHPVPPRRT